MSKSSLIVQQPLTVSKQVEKSKVNKSTETSTMNPGGARIAAVQMVSGPDVENNLRVASELIAMAAGEGAHLVVLPEYFALMSADEKAKVAIREQEGSGRLQDFLHAAAQRHGVWLIGGTIPLEADTPELEADTPDKVRNTVLAFDDAGNQVARYDKIHLFNFQRGEERYDEAATIEAGSHVVAFDSPFGRVGLAACYDLRFPELFRALGVVDLVVLPAAFTYTTGKAHWEVLLRARAIENQCYVAAAAQGGQHSYGRVTWGHSMVVDPWGEVLVCWREGAGIAFADMNPTYTASIRENLPALQHRCLGVD